MSKYPLHASELRLKYVEGYGKSERTETLKLYVPKDGLVGIPRAYFCKQVGYFNLNGIEDRRTDGEEVDLPFKSTLRPHQEELGERFLTALEDSPHNGGILNAPCGYGKTVLGLWVAHQIGQKTLVVVHTSRLYEQWIDRIREHMGIEPGTIREDDFNIDAPIVVAMLHTIRARKYTTKDFESFGLLMVDETHRIAAPHWNQILQAMPMAWRVGLTATPRRKDGLDDAFFFNIGKVLASSQRRDMKPKIFFKRTNQCYRVPTMGNGKVNRARVLNILAKNDDRNNTIAEELLKAATADRHILLLSDRLEMLYHLRRKMKEAGVPDDAVGWVVGAHWTGFDPDDPPAHLEQETTPYKPSAAAIGKIKKVVAGYAPHCEVTVKRNAVRISRPELLPTPELLDIKGVEAHDRNSQYLTLYVKTTGGQPRTKRVPEETLREHQKRRVILATYGLAAEGLDIPEIDVLMLASPRSDVEQPVGRALRVLPDKKQPIIVDFVDAAPYFNRLKGARRRQYKRLGYQVAEVAT
jgi:superfamily II DNA or RNA helicase